MKKEVASKIRSIFTASDFTSAQELLKVAVREYEKTAPKMARWMEQAIPEGLSVFRSTLRTPRQRLRGHDHHLPGRVFRVEVRDLGHEQPPLGVLDGRGEVELGHGDGP